MITPVPVSLQTEINAPVLAWLADKSAHDEVASALLGATRPLQSGAEAADEIGPDWVSFTLFRNDWPAPDLAFWALKSYALARGNA